jgi:hypothetical protein
MVIRSSTVAAAITQVDARTGCKFTALVVFLINEKIKRRILLLPLPHPKSEPGLGVFRSSLLKSREAANRKHLTVK